MKQDDIEQLAAIRLNHSPIVSSHRCSEESCEQAFLLYLLDERVMSRPAMEIAEAIVRKFPVAEEFDAKVCLIEEVAAALIAAAQAARTQALNEALLEVEKRVGLGANKHTLTRAIRSLSTKRDGM